MQELGIEIICQNCRPFCQCCYYSYFNQFFCNSSGRNAHETILSLKSIGAEKTANLLQKAIDQFPDKHVPKNKKERIELVLQIENDRQKLQQP